mmetsp:Transcript_28341/g.64113  ORF Transcript_28341/g.64113 Transcript_28341/m.64113 type:complete len:1000 (+) Transcript_28341:72-3071(+)
MARGFLDELGLAPVAGEASVPAAGAKVAASSTSFRRRFKSALGDVRRVLELVVEAERTLVDQGSLSQIYDAAMRAFGPHEAAPEDYGELCVKRLQALVRSESEDAQLFFQFLADSEIRQNDARVHLARAELEVRAGRIGEAMATVGNALRAGVQPEEPLRNFLRRPPQGDTVAGDAMLAPAAPALAIPRSSSTPIRPRELRYSGCDSQTREALRASFGSRCSEEGDGDGVARPPLRPLAAAYGLEDEEMDAEPLQGGSGAGAAVGRSSNASAGGLESLSPILEADSMEDQPPASWLLAEEVASSAGAPERWCLGPPPLVPPPPVGLPSWAAAAAAAGVAEMEVDEIDPAGAARLPASATARGDMATSTDGAAAVSGDAAVAASLATVADADASDLSTPSACEAAPGAVETDVRQPKTIAVNGVSYTRLRTIGRGGSSKVYEVQAAGGERLALKRVVTSCNTHFEALANEVTLLQQLKDCPNVIQVLDAEVIADGSVILIVMELGGMDLGRLLQSEPDISLGDIQALWRQMLKAVQVIHDKRIVHSDIKPGNFLLVGDQLKLIDFGIAKRISNETTNISRDSSVGTISYMAPEAVQGGREGAFKLGRPADIWSLGIILYQIVYRRSPFSHLEPMQRLYALTDPDTAINFPSGHRLEGHAPETKALLIDILSRCLQRDAHRRPSILELLRHPFLQDALRINRRSFDHVVEAMVTGFYMAARDALCGAGAEEEEECDGSGSADAPQPWDAWQALADKAWGRLACGQDAVEAGTLCVGQKADAALATTELPGLGQFKQCLQHWLVHGAKRQRMADSVASVAEVPAPKALGAGGGSAVPPLGAVAALPLPPVLAPPPIVAPPPTAVRAAPAVPAAETRRPLAVVSSLAASNVNGSGPSLLQAELLQKQRSCLRKVAPEKAVPTASAPGKENVGGGRDQHRSCGRGHRSDGTAAENVVLRRLKDRRAMVATPRAAAEEEQTGLTRWAPETAAVPGGGSGSFAPAR